MGKFVKGAPRPENSGRKRGQPHAQTEEVRKLAKKHGPEAIERLAEIMKSRESNDKDVIAAAEVILDRAYGRASPLPLGDANATVGGVKVIIMGDDAKL